MSGGLIGPDYDKQIRDAIRKIRSMPVYSDARDGTHHVEPAAANLLLKNDSGEAIPPWGCVQVSDVDMGINRIGLVGVKPTGSAGVFVFNGVREIPVDGVGPVHAGPIVRCLFGDGTGANGSTYGPVNDSWELEESTSGIATALGAVPDETDQMFARVCCESACESAGLVPGVYMATADEAIAAGAFGSVTVGETSYDDVRNQSSCTIAQGDLLVLCVAPDCSFFVKPCVCCIPNLCEHPTDSIDDPMGDIDDWATILSGGSAVATGGVMRLSVGATPANNISLRHVGDGTGNSAIFVRSMPETIAAEITIDDFSKSAVGNLSHGTLTFSLGSRVGAIIEYHDSEGSTPTWRPWWRSTGGTVVTGAISLPSIWRIEVELTSESPARGEIRYFLDDTEIWSIGNQTLTLGSDDLLCWCQAIISLSCGQSPFTLQWPDVVADVDSFNFGPA